jgi:hypothetical protein
MQVVLLCRTLNGLGCYGRAAMPGTLAASVRVEPGPRGGPAARIYRQYIYVCTPVGSCPFRREPADSLGVWLEAMGIVYLDMVCVRN